MLQIPTIFFTSIYYERKELLEDPENDSGRRELHVKFSPKEYPLIMCALREMRKKNPVIFKDIPEDDTELKAAEEYDPDDETDEDEIGEEEEEEYEDDEEEVFEEEAEWSLTPESMQLNLKRQKEKLCVFVYICFHHF